MIGFIPKTEDRYAFTNSALIGAPCNIAEGETTIPLDEWHRIKDAATGKEDGHCKRTRMRTLMEVFKDLDARLEVFICNYCKHERKPRCRKTHGADYGGDACPECGKGEYEALIDEYFSGPSADGPVPHDYRWVACFAVTGGSEGHYIHVDFMVPVDRMVASEGDFGEKQHELSIAPGCRLWRNVRLALGKTFKGMDHACEIARRCAVLLGA